MRSNSSVLRILSITLIAGVFTLIWGRPAGAQGASNLNWSSDLGLKSLADVPNRLHGPVFAKDQPQTPLKINLANGNASREIGNCDDYLSGASAGFHPADNLSNKMAASFVRQCYVLRDLQHAHAAASVNSFGWSRDSLSQLPPMLVAGSREVTDAAEKAEAQGLSWQQFDPSLKITGRLTRRVGAEDSRLSYSLEILARGDFNGDGNGDVAVYGCAVGKGSTWFQCKYFVFSPNNQGKLVRLTEDRAPFRIKAKIPN